MEHNNNNNSSSLPFVKAKGAASLNWKGIRKVSNTGANSTFVMYFMAGYEIKVYHLQKTHTCKQCINIRKYIVCMYEFSLSDQSNPLQWKEKSSVIFLSTEENDNGHRNCLQYTHFVYMCECSSSLITTQVIPVTIPRPSYTLERVRGMKRADKWSGNALVRYLAAANQVHGKCSFRPRHCQEGKPNIVQIGHWLQ